MPKTLDDIAAAQGQFDRAFVDPRAVLAAARTPADLAVWVRDRTRPVAYPGALRGPLGVLLDRRGNSLDRALLLARLIGLTNKEVRVVSGPAAAAAAASTGAPAPSPSEELPQRKAAAAIANTILARVGSVAVPRLQDSVRYWVQYKEAGTWTDADPATGLVAPAKGNPATILDLDPASFMPRAGAGRQLRHTVTMRLTVERWEAGRLMESPLAAVPLDQSQGPLVSVTFGIVPVDPATGRPSSRNFSTGVELKALVLSETLWAPIFSDGQKWRIGKTFNDAGIVGEPPVVQSGVGQFSSGAASALGGLGGGLGGDEPEAPPSVLTALFADYDITVPGRSAGHVRRVVFDSIGPENRRTTDGSIPRPSWTDEQRAARGTDIAAVNDTLVAFASPDMDTYIFRYAERVVGARDAILQAAAGTADDDTIDRAAQALSYRTLELYASARLLDSQLAIVEPQIFRRVVRQLPNANAAGVDVQAIADLAWNRVGPSGASATAATFITQGVLDTVQESAIILRDGTPRPAEATSALFEEAARQRIDITAFRPSDVARLAAFPPIARARMADDLDAGYVLVAPARPVTIDGAARAGWWRVDPQTGHVVGAMDTGWLQDYAEWQTTQEVNGVKIVRWHKLRVGPAARAWANRAVQLRGNTSWTQWNHLLRIAQQSINATGGLPPIW
jgi:hypothetical protein